MHVVCEHCAERISVPEDQIHGHRVRVRCPRCGGAMIIASSKGNSGDAGPDSFRDSMDTLPVDPRSIARLAREAEGAEVDSLLEASSQADVDALLDASHGDAEVSALLLRAVSGTREEQAPEVSALFELQPPAPIPLAGPRLLKNALKNALKDALKDPRPPQASIPFELAGELPGPRPPQATIAFELRRPSEPSDAPHRGRRLGLVVVLLVLAGLGFLVRGRLGELLAVLRAMKF